MALLLVRVGPAKREPRLACESGKPALRVKLLKALRGALQAALPLWGSLSGFLVDELGFTTNPRDPRAASKIINGKQRAALWRVDDAKAPRVEQGALDSVVGRVSERRGQEAPLAAQRGPAREYLGMTIDYSEGGKVKLLVADFVEGALGEAPSDAGGAAASPAASHLFAAGDKAEKLDGKRADLCHRLTAKLLRLSKRARPGFQAAASLLATRVTQPDVDDWKKLGRAVKFLRDAQDPWLTLEVGDELRAKWRVDASFGARRGKRSHAGATASLGKGSPVSSPTRQKLSARSSAEAELAGVDDSAALAARRGGLPRAQGLEVAGNVARQGNQSAALLERNGRASSGRRARRVDARRYFVADGAKQGGPRAERRPAGDGLGGFFAKPLQGCKFRKFQRVALSLPSEAASNSGSTAAQERAGKRSRADAARDGVARAGKPRGPMTQAAGPVEVPVTDLTSKATKAGNKLSLLPAS